MPSSFKDLERKELYRSAIEDFAVEVKERDSAEIIRAALFESGVEWKDYVAQHPEVAPVVVETKRHPNQDNVVTSVDLKAPTQIQVLTAAPAVPQQEAMYLVKMSRANHYFEFGRYKFTNDHPFVVMDADSTNRILSQETGFAIATPLEASEYYA